MPTKHAGEYLPSDATPFTATNASDITSTTPVTIKAAPTSNKLYITRIIVTNKTAGEAPHITIKDGAASPVTLFQVIVGGAQSYDSGQIDPPIPATAAKSLTGEAGSAVGDVVVTILGYSGNPTATAT